jgi:hypothetical protein
MLGPPEGAVDWPAERAAAAAAASTYTHTRRWRRRRRRVVGSGLDSFLASSLAFFSFLHLLHSSSNSNGGGSKSTGTAAVGVSPLGLPAGRPYTHPAVGGVGAFVDFIHTHTQVAFARRRGGRGRREIGCLVWSVGEE